MAPPIVRFPFDRTGRDRNNFVPGEVHQLDTKDRRLIVPLYGAFYGDDTLTLVDNYTKKKLDHIKQYVFESVRPEAVALSGKGAYGVIVVTDPAVSSSVSLSYQAVGGEFQNHTEDAEYLAEILSNDNRPPTVANMSDIPDAFTPSKHWQNIWDFSNFDGTMHRIERLRMLHNLGARLDADSTWAYVDNALAKLSQDGANTMTLLMAQHNANQHAHDQYVLTSEIDKYILPLRQPVNVTPSVGQTNVALDVTLTAGAYLSLYRVAEATVQFQVGTSADFSTAPVFDVTVTGNSFHYNDILLSNTLYYWRCRYADINGAVSPWSAPTPFTTMAVSVGQPLITSPTNGDSSNAENPTLIATAFAITGATDTQAAADWEVWTGPNGTGTRIWASLADTVNKTSIQIPLGVLTRQTTYYPRVRYKASKYGYSAWSNGASFWATWPLRPTVMGQSFGGGFWGGDIVIGANTYAIIVAPKASGEKSNKLVGNLINTPASASTNDSVANTTGLAALTGTSLSAAAAWVKALAIGTYTDWQIPAKDVLATVYNNLNPAGANTPAIYKTGGSEAFQANYYWTSTTYDYSVVTNYTTGGDPIYDTQTTQSNVPHSFNDGPVGESAADAYAAYITCPSGQGGPNNVSGPNFRQSGTLTLNGDPIGYFSASWTCSTTVTKTVIVGYTPVEYGSYTTNYYRAYAQTFSGGSQTTYDKTGTYLIRAVRLVKVA